MGPQGILHQHRRLHRRRTSPHGCHFPHRCRQAVVAPLLLRPPQEYVSAFTTLLLSVQGLSPEQTHFQFPKGLQHWTRQEVDRRGATDFPTAARIVEALQDTRRLPPRTQITTTPRSTGTPALPPTKPVPPYRPPPDSSALPPLPTRLPRGASPVEAPTGAPNAPKNLLVTLLSSTPSPPWPRQLILNYTPSHSTS